MLTDLQKRLVELDLRKVEIRAIYEEMDNIINQLVKEHGVDFAFQAEDGIVYKLAQAKGQYVTFKQYEVLRTKRPDERAGTLSVKEAESLGFKVKS